MNKLLFILLMSLSSFSFAQNYILKYDYMNNEYKYVPENAQLKYNYMENRYEWVPQNNSYNSYNNSSNYNYEHKPVNRDKWWEAQKYAIENNPTNKMASALGQGIADGFKSGYNNALREQSEKRMLEYEHQLRMQEIEQMKQIQNSKNYEYVDWEVTADNVYVLEDVCSCYFTVGDTIRLRKDISDQAISQLRAKSNPNVEILNLNQSSDVKEPN